MRLLTLAASLFYTSFLFKVEAKEVALPYIAPYESMANHAVLMDMHTGAILYSKDSKTLMAPSSMTKLLFAYTVFDHLKNKHATLEDKLLVSKKAWKTPGSRMFLQVNTEVPVKELIKGVLIVSGNDACVTLAEGFFGTEEAAVDRMNILAQKIGMTHTHFKNVHGLPNPDHNTTASDLALLSKRLIEDFPEFFAHFSEKSYEYNKIKQPNLNPVLEMTPPGDFGKTGYTDRGGYGLTASAQREDMRLIMVINGLRTMHDRRNEAQRLLGWGFREFKTYKIFKAGEVVESAEVWLGEKETIPLIIKDDFLVTLPKRHPVKAELQYEGPLQTPIKKDQKVGKLTIEMPGGSILEQPVYAGADVESLKGFKKIKTAVHYLLYGSDKPQKDKKIK
jgi:serine-type D-Ala-D-Ala carboxypeptidase (penicillin-binding protein 5/6)